jgi:5-(carboxyamino)imidazole ribonucleotide synthase
MENQWYGKNLRLGILGGGQLGRMFIQEAINYDVHVHSLDPDPNAPCKSIAHEFTVGSLTDYETVLAFGKDKDVITIEIENVNIEALSLLEKEGKKVFPQPHIIKTIQDKGLQKVFYTENNIPTAPFKLIEDKSDLINNSSNFPFVQKMRTGGYDGKGVQIIRNEADYTKAFETPSIIEEMIPFSKELSVIVARNEKGETQVYPTVECEFNPEANLVEFLFSPADISTEIENKACEIAIDVINKLGMVGILAVEFFLLEDGSLLVNEIAPRPHNSGHHTIECNITSQFEQHMRSVLNMPLGSTKMIHPGVMINLVGEENFEGDVYYEGINDIIALEGVKVHLYGKNKTKSFRKMGHITIFDEHIDLAKTKARQVQKMIKVKAS